MKIAVTLLALLVLVAVAIAQNTNLTSANTFGIDMVVLDTPSWVTSIQRSGRDPTNLDRTYNVFGGNVMRSVEISTDYKSFTALPLANPWIDNDYQLVDFRCVPVTNATSNTTYEFVVGVTDYTVDFPTKWSFNQVYSNYLPFFYMVPANTGSNGGPYVQNTVQNVGNTTYHYDGMMFYAVRVDTTNPNDALAYYAGWYTSTDATTGFFRISFAVIRMHLDLLSPFSGGINSYGYFLHTDQDVSPPLYTGQFTGFSQDYKPFLHIIPYGYNNGIDTLVIVADPNTRSVYVGYYDDSNVNATSSYSQLYAPIAVGSTGNRLVSTALDATKQILYVGLSLSGSNTTGSIVVINLISGVSQSYNLPPNCNNPKALAIDQDNQILYIGLNGAPAVLKFDLTKFVVVGYQRLPEWLHRSWSAEETRDHIMFVTYEQNSKVFRVAKTDFCTTLCPYNGYCTSGSCACGDGYSMQDGQCQVTQLVKIEKEYHTVHGGEITLGIFFMFAVIAAAAGWYMWYRARRGSYQPV